MMTSCKKWLLYLIYPTLVFGGVALHLWAVAKGWDIRIATYIPMLTTGAIITLLELKFPYRKAWHPTQKDLASDIAFMLLVQITLPTILSFMITVALKENLTPSLFDIKGAWPHSWSTLNQSILMLLIADFFGYWIHRYAHKWPGLWRFHAVHHSPHKLYWINVGRFHPVEKSYQYLFSTLPFIVMGVNLEVLSTYFVIYGINGFFQHCNIDVKLGPLNYIFSGPELHHWHHSKIITESNHNYGNTLIIYDLMFGSYFFPKDGHVETLGLINRQYPSKFFSLLKSPFTKDLDKNQP